MSLQKALCALFCFFLFSPTPEAGPVLVCAMIAMDGVVNTIAANFTDGQIVNLNYAGRTFSLKLGSKLGRGAVGTVVEIASQSIELPYSGVLKGNFVMKIPNRLKLQSSPPMITEHYVHLEYDLYARLKASWETNRTENSGLRETSYFPILPIILAAESDLGFVLIKPRVNKNSLSGGVTQQMKANGGKLNPYQRVALEKVFNISQRLAKELGIWPDLRFQNLAYIDDPKDLQNFGMNVPGFIWVDFSTHPTPLYANKSFESYLREVEAHSLF